jgi:hypothetical protein
MLCEQNAEFLLRQVVPIVTTVFFSMISYSQAYKIDLLVICVCFCRLDNVVSAFTCTSMESIRIFFFRKCSLPFQMERADCVC